MLNQAVVQDSGGPETVRAGRGMAVRCLAMNEGQWPWCLSCSGEGMTVIVCAASDHKAQSGALSCIEGIAPTSGNETDGLK